MRKTLFGLAGAAAFSLLAGIPAIAADLVYKAPHDVMTWTGCYVGGNVGWAASWQENRNTANTTAFGDFTPGQGFNYPISGFIGGGQVGCNYQTGRWVWGIEGSYSGASIKGDSVSVFGAADDNFTTKIDGIATVTGRVGMAFGQWLVYSKAGWAGARVTFSVSDTVAPVGAGTQTVWHNGITVGSGIEYAWTKHWIVGFESNYYRFESKTYEIGGGPAAGLYTWTSRPRDVFSALGRLSYKW